MKKDGQNQKGSAQAPYISPSTKIVEISVQKVLCMSGGGNEGYTNNDDPQWFNTL